MIEVFLLFSKSPSPQRFVSWPKPKTSNSPVLSQCSEGPEHAPALHQCLAPPPGQKWTSVGCQTPPSALWWWLSPDGSVNNKAFCLSISSSPLSSLKLNATMYLHTHADSVWKTVQEVHIWFSGHASFLHHTCSGSLSCSRPLCLSVVCRIFTSSTGLQDDSRGISSKSLSTKLSWRWGSSIRKSLRVAETVRGEHSET